MRVALTGTPGTGKSTVATDVADALGLDVVRLSERASEFAADVDEARDTLEVDVDAMRDALADLDDVLFDGHLSHHLEVDHVVVLRCRPDALVSRLRERGWSDEKVRENEASEALDVVTAEAVEIHGAVLEVDTTEMEAADTVDAVVQGVRRGEVNADETGASVDWSDHLEALSEDLVREAGG